MKKALAIFLLLVLSIGSGQALYKARKGFSIRRVQGDVRIQIEIWDSAYDSILSKPFQFLGRGRQCFAFESFDGKYVLKLPRTDIYRTPFWMRTLPFLSSLRKERDADRTKREKAVLESMRIAYEKLQEDTGVLGLHFGETADQGRWITLYDPMGAPIFLPAHKTAFVLQKKQPILMRSFMDALKHQDRQEAKRILDAFIDVVVARGAKGIANKDGSFLRNYGFDGQKGYQIDIASFYYTKDGQQSISDTMSRVRSWLEATDRDMLNYFEDSLRRKLYLLSNEQREKAGKKIDYKSQTAKTR